MTITLPNANYSLVNANGSLVLNDSGHTITITGAGQTLAIIQMQAPATNRVLHVATGTTATISGVTVEGGGSTGSPGGGGILNDGTLNLTDSTVTGNASASSGGGVYLDGVAATLTDDTITANSAGSGGGVTMERDQRHLGWLGGRQPQHRQHSGRRRWDRHLGSQPRGLGEPQQRRRQP